jgi:hypothetical protein
MRRYSTLYVKSSNSWWIIYQDDYAPEFYVYAENIGDNAKEIVDALNEKETR